jgi:hypothetical protein
MLCVKALFTMCNARCKSALCVHPKYLKIGIATYSLYIVNVGTLYHLGLIYVYFLHCI